MIPLPCQGLPGKGHLYAPLASKTCRGVYTEGTPRGMNHGERGSGREPLSKEAHLPSHSRFCSGNNPWRVSPGQTGPPEEKGGVRGDLPLHSHTCTRTPARSLCSLQGRQAHGNGGAAQAPAAAQAGSRGHPWDGPPSEGTDTCRATCLPTHVVSHGDLGPF